MSHLRLCITRALNDETKIAGQSRLLENDFGSADDKGASVTWMLTTQALTALGNIGMIPAIAASSHEV